MSHPFAFVGRLPSSKSIMNRLLLAKSYFSAFEVGGDSACDDVRRMKKAVDFVLASSGSPGSTQIEVEAGSAGTVLRFMALRLSRIPGEHVIRGHERLFVRPQEELVKILRQLGVEAFLNKSFLSLKGDGWRMHGDTLLVPFSRSSQFATAVLLNAWDLPFDLYVSLGGQKVSEGYWRMSTRLAQLLGMRIDFWDGDFRVPRGQKVSVDRFEAEIDVSSAFALAAVAAVSGSATILDFPEARLQPDAVFPGILERMGVPLSLHGSALKIERAMQLSGVAVNLKNTPDLFPVLAVLCALAKGESDLYGAPHLVHKESDRLNQIAELIARLGRTVKVKEDGLVVGGSLGPSNNRDLGAFDCDQDHRLAFAAGVLKAAGFDIEILHPEVVSKSFPEFWSILGWNPLSQPC